MPRTTDPIQQLSAAMPELPTSQSVSPESIPVYRTFCDWLQLARHCTPACRHAHACTDDPVQCFHAFYGCSSEEAHIWVRTGMLSIMHGRTARQATREADAALLAQLKTVMKLPLRGEQRRCLDKKGAS